MSFEAFGHNEPITDADLEIYRSIQNAPMYRPDLDICIMNSKGEVCSSCVVWLDEGLDLGVFEPVGTRPGHQREGLGKAVLHEGLRRLKALCIAKAIVHGFGETRTAFYRSCGFTEKMTRIAGGQRNGRG